MNANRKLKKVTTLALTAVLATTVSMGPVYAADKGVEKEETVYVRTTSSGEIESTIVSDWLKNKDGLTTIEDTSSLQEIENVKGDETFSQDGDNLTWKADGNDIFYQGKSDKELPVSLKVTYYLNDKEMVPAEMAGQSGHVKMKFDYSNQMKSGNIYTPFLLATTMMLDADTFSNVEIDHGKIVNDGTRNVVVGFGFPGLRESLNLDSVNFDGQNGLLGMDFSEKIPEGFEIEADVTDFQTSVAMTVATPLDLSDFTTDDIKGWNDIQDKLNALTDGMAQLEDGTGELADGMKELQKGCDELLGGMDELDGGAGAIEAGAKELYAGLEALDQSRPDLVSGVNALVAGADQLEANKQALVGGASTLAAGIQSVSDNLGNLQAGSQQVTEGINGVNSALPGTLDQMIGQLQQLSADIAATEAETGADLSGLTNETNQLYGEITYLKSYLYGESGAMPQLAAGSGQVTAGISQISDGVSGQLVPGSQSLSTGVSTLYNSGIDVLTGGLHTLGDKMPTLNNGIAALTAGAGNLYDGTKTLKSGTTELKNGGDALADGVLQLLEGSNELKDGMKKFDEDGIQKITGFLQGDVKTIVNRLEAIKEQANSYRSFSEESGHDNDSVKFVIETEGIK